MLGFDLRINVVFFISKGDFIWEEDCDILEVGLFFEWRCCWDEVWRVVVFLGGEELLFNNIFSLWRMGGGDFVKFGGGLDGRGGGEDLGRGGRFFLLFELKVIRLFNFGLFLLFFFRGIEFFFFI